jgi:hypothetical protein
MNRLSQKLYRMFLDRIIYNVSKSGVSSKLIFIYYQVLVWITGWTTGRSGFDPRQGQRTFPVASVSRPALGPTQSPVQWVQGVLSPGVKARPGRDADHSPPSSAEIENE